MIKQAAIVLAVIAITACGEEQVATTPVTTAPITETTGEIVLAETAEMAKKMMAEAALIEAQAEATIE